MAILIREAQHKDITEIKNYLTDLWTWHSENEPDLLDEKRMRNYNSQGYCEKCLADPDKCRLFIADDEGKIAGFLKVNIQEIDSFFKNPTILYLDDVFVLPEYRRKGIARSLIEHAEKFAKEKSIKRIQARVYTFNNGMHKCLESLNYRSPYATWDKEIG